MAKWIVYSALDPVSGSILSSGNTLIGFSARGASRKLSLLPYPAIWLFLVIQCNSGQLNLYTE